MIFGSALGTIAALSSRGPLRFPIASPWLLWVPAAAGLVASGYFGVGARVAGKRVAQTFVRLVVDMTGAFPAWTAIVASGVHRSLPAPDGTVPDERAPSARRRARPSRCSGVRRFRLWSPPLGGARRARMVARGLAAGAVDAEFKVRSLRPGVRTMSALRRRIDRVPATLGR